jgi:hypothetical protein
MSNGNSTALQRVEDTARTAAALSTDAEVFATAQRMALALASSTIVPTNYRNNVANVMVAMEYAHRLGASVLAVMQNLHIIQGKPSLGASFLIGTVNACGRFTPLRFKWQGTEGQDDWGCRAYAKDVATGEECRGPLITIELAKKEGWYGKKDSKWQTIPELMLMYRAGAWWSRVYCPELSLGLHTTEEMADLGPVRETRATALANALDAGDVEPDAEPTPLEMARAELSALMEWFPSFSGDMTKEQSRKFITATQVFDNENADAVDMQEQVDILRALQAELQPQAALV